MKRTSYLLLAASLGLATAAALMHASAGPLTDPPFQQKERQAETGGLPVSSFPARRVVTVSPGAQARVGLRVIALRAVKARRRITAPAVVLSAESLAASRNAYVVAQAKLEKARVSLSVAQAEYARVKKLYQDDRNVSQKTFQAAQAALRSDRIDVHATQLELDLQAAIVRQSWGPVVAKWVENPSSALAEVLQQNVFLVQVSLPPGDFFPSPSAVRLSLPGGETRRAKFVSSLPRVDPRVQGTSLLYRTPARAGLAPGVTLVAHLPIGRLVRGIVMPAAAVVWSQGKAWAYVQTDRTHFVRRALGATFAFDGGFFLSRGFSAGEDIVVAGAETLLSEELSPTGSPQAAGGSD